MQVASLGVVCDFAIKSQGKVKAETVIKFFKKCEISNVMDDTENNFCYGILMTK